MCKDVIERLIADPNSELMSHMQLSLLLYVLIPSEIVPEDAPEDGLQEQLPEHVTTAVCFMLYDSCKKSALVTACESCCGKRPLEVEQVSPALLHTVSQLWPLPPSFHSRTPATAHVNRVEVAILPAMLNNELLLTIKLLHGQSRA